MHTYCSNEPLRNLPFLHPRPQIISQLSVFGSCGLAHLGERERARAREKERERETLCVCERERMRERKREKKREKERETERSTIFAKRGIRAKKGRETFERKASQR